MFSGCGDDGDFDAEGFINEANEHGAGLELGEPLESARESTEIYEIAFAEHETGAEAGGDAHGGGSLTVTPSADEGRAEWERCESAATLTCYRAANVVLIFEGELEAEDQSRLVNALAGLASG